MFTSVTSAEYTPQAQRPRSGNSRFQTTILLLNLALWTIALLGKTLRSPDTFLVVASIVLICLEIPMLSYTILRMSSNSKFRHGWMARKTVPSWLSTLVRVFNGFLVLSLLGNLNRLPGNGWNEWNDIALPFLMLFLAFGDAQVPVEAPHEEDPEETRRRWWFAYKMGRRAGAFF